MAATEDDTDPRCRPAGIMWSSLRNGDQRSAEATLTGEMPINFDKLWPGTTTKVYSGVQLKERPLIGLGHAVAAPFIASEGIYVVCIIESFNTKKRTAIRVRVGSENGLRSSAARTELERSWDALQIL